ncbi:hypothetical protein FRAAL2551 [Frankia alni ACN14a]|uniref:Uncharacterized protein n=1 Tax=Frankia alni (strain DSM 45986 / CECT 9034 / ACN14a) TaxID=326424 RepID=Q0RMP9_FRAAA|nr:hypothetical protein FRAAL2551 [Frankia alni ACN14a]
MSGLADRSHPDAIRIERTAHRLGNPWVAEAALERMRTSWSHLALVMLAC